MLDDIREQRDAAAGGTAGRTGRQRLSQTPFVLVRLSDHCRLALVVLLIFILIFLVFIIVIIGIPRWQSAKARPSIDMARAIPADQKRRIDFYASRGDAWRMKNDYEKAIADFAVA